MPTANNLTNYGADQTAAWWAGKTWYAALMTTKTTKLVAGVEVAAADYARQSVTLSPQGGGSHGVILNAAQIDFGTPATDWGTVLGITLYDQLEGGNSWMFFDLTAGVGCAAGAPVSIPAGIRHNPGTPYLIRALGCCRHPPRCSSSPFAMDPLLSAR